jgi:hypothetical protein
MTTATLKRKIKALVDEKRDAKSLRRIFEQLNDPALESGPQASLLERLNRAEADFKAGRVTDVESGRKRLHAGLKKLRAAQAKRA